MTFSADESSPPDRPPAERAVRRELGSPQADAESGSNLSEVVELPAASSEFEDEPPGAYLRELGVGSWAVVWTSIHVTVTVAIGLAWWIEGGVFEEGTVGVLAPLWALAPVSAILALVTVLWFARVPGNASCPWAVRISWVGACGTLVLWGVLRFGFGVQLPVNAEPRIENTIRPGISAEEGGGSE